MDSLQNYKPSVPLNGPLRIPSKFDLSAQSTNQPVFDNKLNQAWSFDIKKPAANAPTQPQGFHLPDFSKHKVIHDDNLFDKNFRLHARDALKDTLRHYKDRDTVANTLWNERGYGTTLGEVKRDLRKLETEGKLSYGQVKAVRRKLRID